MSRKFRPWVTAKYTDLCQRQPGKEWTWEQMLTGKTPVVLFVTGGRGKRDENGPFLRVSSDRRALRSPGSTIKRESRSTGR